MSQGQEANEESHHLLSSYSVPIPLLSNAARVWSISDEFDINTHMGGSHGNVEVQGGALGENALSVNGDDAHNEDAPTNTIIIVASLIDRWQVLWQSQQPSISFTSHSVCLDSVAL